MNRKWIIAMGVLLATFFFLAYKVATYYQLLPQSVGFLVIDDMQSENWDSEVLINASEDESGLSNTIKAITTLPEATGKDMEVDAIGTALQEESEMFYYEEITQEIKDRITGVSYADNCQIPYEDLRYLKVLYWGFDQKTHEGELIVNKTIAEDIVDIFKELYEQKYPIERIVLVDEYDADDNASMAANNTSAFNYRVVDKTDRLSIHSYGLAIDINPLYNPYVREVDGKTVITPVNGEVYANRNVENEYYIRKDDICYNAFVSRGFTWGGEWNTMKDYQHFQKKPE